MLLGWRIPVLLLLLLLVAGAAAQSGDRDSDTELRLNCFSYITMKESNLSCQLLGGSDGDDGDDDEDGERDDIEKITVCQTRFNGPTKTVKCLESPGSEVTSKELDPLLHVNTTVHLKTGGRLSTIVDLCKIVKLRRPRVWNTTFDPESNQMIISIQVPSNDYVPLEKQILQLKIWADGLIMIQNISSKNVLQINMQHLNQHSEHNVKVRAIPSSRKLQGTWSEWSETLSFFTPPGENVPNKTEPQELKDQQLTVYRVSACLVCVVVVMSSIVVFWKNKIFPYMWPIIPHPKKTLVQICKPNKGLLLSLNPEVFSSLKVCPLEQTHCDEAEPSSRPAVPGGSQSSSTQSSNCSSTTSVSTEELEISGLLSRSSSDGEDSLPSITPSTTNILQQGGRLTPQPDGEDEVETGVNQQEEAYVTMSSFYQIK